MNKRNNQLLSVLGKSWKTHYEVYDIECLDIGIRHKLPALLNI